MKETIVDRPHRIDYKEKTYMIPESIPSEEIARLMHTVSLRNNQIEHWQKVARVEYDKKCRLMEAVQDILDEENTLHSAKDRIQAFMFKQGGIPRWK